MMLNAEFLERRASQLLGDATLPSRHALMDSFLAPLMCAGELALIGGALRDIAFMPVRRFQSDLDFVIDVRNRAFFETFVRRWPLTTNSFGGYSLALGTLKVDFWDIERTWARVKRLRDVSCLEDVLETTFFNIDALMFVVSDGRFVEREGALSAIREKRLSINLKDNPNPLGATVRTLRRMYQFDLCLSEELAEFVAEGIDHFGWSAVVQRDFEAYPLRPIAHAIFGEAPRDGREFLETLTACEYRLPGSQMELPFRTAS